MSPFILKLPVFDQLLERIENTVESTSHDGC